MTAAAFEADRLDELTVPVATLAEVHTAFAECRTPLDLIALDDRVDAVLAAAGLLEEQVRRALMARVFALDQLIRGAETADWVAEADGAVRPHPEVYGVAASLPMVQWPDGSYGFDFSTFRRVLSDARG